MNARSRYILTCLASGVLVVTMVALLGFWMRWLCMDSLGGLVHDYYPDISVLPLGLLPEEIENAPNVEVHSAARLVPNKHTLAPWRAGLGAVDYFYGLTLWSGRSDVLVWEPAGDWVHYDRRRGLIVSSWVEKVSPRDGGPRRAERVWLYAGPEGMAETPSEALGRFRSPVVTSHDFFLYDAQHRRFFKLDFEERKVVKGPEIDPDQRREPVQIRSIGKRSEMFSWEVFSPKRKKDPNESEVPTNRFGRIRRQADSGAEIVPTVGLVTRGGSQVFVLDASGRIDLLDPKILTLTHRVGALPAVDEFFGRPRGLGKPRSLFAYDVRPVLRATGDVHSKWPYLGCVAGAYNRDGTCMTMATFNKQGSPVGGATRWTVEYEDVPGGPMVTTARFLLENLHPPALLLLSHFSAPYAQAGAGYRSLFVVPDSFVAKKGLDVSQPYGLRLCAAIIMMIPAIILALFLAVLVGRNAQTVGFSKDVRTLWILITVAFGLPAYITYRLTKPGATLVTCANCGLVRRPDMDRCHRCNSPWEVPELKPPTWRVLDGGRAAVEEPPMPAQEAAAE